MSHPSISRADSLSSASSFSSADTDVDFQTTTSKPSEIKRTRKRFSQEQLIVLEHAYHKTSHPTREDREEIAKQADMSVKSVTIWFQNKRQAERKQALNKSTENNAPPPLAMYPARPSSAQPLSTNSSNRLSPMTSHLSIPPSKPQSRLPARTASGFLSLDRIASRTERILRTPTKLTRHISFYEPRPRSPGALWDSMLSSPIQPEQTGNMQNAPPESPSARDYLDFASSRRGSRGNVRGRCTLELACAAARMTVDKADELKNCTERCGASPVLDFEQDNQILPMEDDDVSTEIIDTEMESIGDSHEAITPNASHIMFDEELSPSDVRLIDVGKMILDDFHPEKDTELLDAAWALCGLSTLRR
ncbi:hypothetical protein ACEPAF_3981 [Sanghuangporus sanghuang]